MSTAAGHEVCDRLLKSQKCELFCVLGDMICSKNPAVKAALNHW